MIMEWLKGICMLFLVLWATAGCVEGTSIRVGSFNADVFGKTKFGKDHVVSAVCQIVLHYDIIFIMEIRDSSETVIYDFLDRVNSDAGEGVVYELVTSVRLGRSTRKEQYAYLYRNDRVYVESTFQYEDAEDVFEFEPFAVLVTSIYPEIPAFFLLGVRAKPQAVLSELNHMDDVFEEVATFFQTRKGIIVGDLRADCSDLSRSEYNGLDLKSERFLWAIGSSEDTTTGDSSCAYDRVIVGADLANNFLQSKSEVFRFDREFDLTFEQAAEVSDHYPVGLQIEDEQSVLDQLLQKGLDLELRRRQSVAIGVDVIRLASFNIQVFGTSKFSKPEVVEVLSRIVRLYDITLIQEIRDVSETVIYDFLDRVNRDAAPVGVVYELIVSARLGRTSSKEQYAYIYRTDTVELATPFLYDDSGDDVFEREPYAILVRSKLLALPDFFLLGLHVSPDFVTPELNRLDEVFTQATQFYGTENGIILGDLNADCSYLSRTRYEQLDLVNDGRFTWLIDSSEDTTTKASHCAYDRFIVAGEILDYVVADSAGPFLFDEAYQLSQELTEDVSDHYPIQLQIQGNLLTESPAPSSNDSSSDAGGAHLPSTITVYIALTLGIAIQYCIRT